MALFGKGEGGVDIAFGCFCCRFCVCGGGVWIAIMLLLLLLLSFLCLLGVYSYFDLDG